MYATWIYPAFAVFSAITGIAVAWGMMRASIEDIKEHFSSLQEGSEVLQKTLTEVREEMRVRFATLEANGYHKSPAKRRR